MSGNLFNDPRTSAARMPDIVWKRWIIGTDGERELRKSMLSVRLDDDDDDNGKIT